MMKITYSPDFQDSQFILNKIGDISMTLEGAELKLYSKSKEVVFIIVEENLLKLIAQILKDYRGESWISVKEMPFIPQSSEEFEVKKQDILGTVLKLRAQIQELQSSIDEMVSRLYGVSEISSGYKIALCS